MKRIDATIQGNKIGAVSSAVNDLVSGFTILEGNGESSVRDKQSEQVEELALLLQNTIKLQPSVQL